MKKIVGLLVILLALSSFGQMNLLSNMVQPAAHIEGSAISYTNGYYVIPGGVWVKGLEDTTGTADGVKAGVLAVHLVGDAASSYTLVPIRHGECRGVMFDKIRQSGTTITLVNLILYTTTNP